MASIYIREPFISRKLFSEVGLWSFVWLVVRVYLGWQWLHAGWGKVMGAGAHPWGPNSILGYWERAVMIPETGRAAITYDWYRVFLQFLIDINAESWFAPLIAWGELIIGLMLIIGAFVGIFAAFGAFMNMNFMLAGTASTNPVLLLLAILLMLGWKTAGWWGMDRWLLPKIGVPWSKVEVKANSATD
jgi:thiosulfate dehydrogenase (quinone) large subunit